MIGWLQGRTLHHLSNGADVIDVQGVGYEVHVAAKDNLELGELVELFIHTVVRSDAILLYGFVNYDDRAFFEQLLATPGVGPSTALMALRTMSRSEMAAAIEHDDAKRVASIPGIGAKTASRIVLELKGKVVSGESYVVDSGESHPLEMEDALRGLGYSTFEIRQALAGVALADDESTALREALQLLRRP